jgi:LPS export ABC transporter protein LptC
MFSKIINFLPSEHDFWKNSKFELKNFRRSSNKDGRKLWEIVADRGTYDPDKNISRLYSPNLELFKEDNKSYTIKSESADIELDGSELKNANLHGQVKATLDNDTELNTESAIFDYSNNKITSTAPVLIENELLKINADNFEFDTNTQILVLKGNLKTFIKAKNEKK